MWIERIADARLQVFEEDGRWAWVANVRRDCLGPFTATLRGKKTFVTRLDAECDGFQMLDDCYFNILNKWNGKRHTT